MSILLRYRIRKIICFQNYKTLISNKAFQGTVVNRVLPSLHEGPFEIEITLTVSLREKTEHKTGLSLNKFKIKFQ